MRAALPQEILELFHPGRPADELPGSELKAARLLFQQWNPTAAEIRDLMELGPRDPVLREPQGFPPSPPVLRAAAVTSVEELFYVAAELLADLRYDEAGLRARLALATEDNDDHEHRAATEPSVELAPSDALPLHRRLAQVAELLLAERARQAHRSRARRWGSSSRRGRAQRPRA